MINYNMQVNIYFYLLVNNALIKFRNFCPSGNTYIRIKRSEGSVDRNFVYTQCTHTLAATQVHVHKLTHPTSDQTFPDAHVHTYTHTTCTRDPH